MQHSVYDKVSVMKTSTGNSATLVPEMMVLRRSCFQKVTLASVIFALACGNDQRVPAGVSTVTVLVGQTRSDEIAIAPLDGTNSQPGCGAGRAHELRRNHDRGGRPDDVLEGAAFSLSVHRGGVLRRPAVGGRTGCQVCPGTECLPSGVAEAGRESGGRVTT